MSDARPWDLVLFDLDGTLIETSPEILDAVNDTMDSCGFPPVSQEQVNVWIGRGTRELLAQALRMPAFERRQSPDGIQREAEHHCQHECRCG
jgi:phosphoglycolate phosphatase